MAVHVVQSPIDLPVFDAQPRLHSSRTVSGTHPDGTPETNLGAFRGLAFALVFETVLVILGGLAWQVFRAIH
jgi:hypothetical protein